MYDAGAVALQARNRLDALTRGPAAPTLAVRLAAYLAVLVPVANLASAQIYRIETLLGDFDPLEEVPVADAWVRHPTAVAIDSEGSLYFFVDRDTYRMRKVDPSGRVSAVAGSALFGYGGDGGPATSARLGERVEGLAVDGEGNVYIGDTENYRIRRVDTAGTIETIAGTGAWGTQGDGGPAKRAGLTAVQGLALDAAGNLYIADTWDDRIRYARSMRKASSRRSPVRARRAWAAAEVLPPRHGSTSRAGWRSMHLEACISPTRTTTESAESTRTGRSLQSPAQETEAIAVTEGLLQRLIWASPMRWRWMP